MSLTAHLRYRVLGLLVSCIVISGITLALAGLTPVTWLQLISVSLAAAPLAPMYALVLGSIARNKVQGFALVKAMGIVAVPCAYAYFMPEPWQRLFALIPHYWPLKAHWLFDAQRTQAALLHVLLGVMSHVIMLSLLLRRFKECIGR